MNDNGSFSGKYGCSAEVVDGTPLAYEACRAHMVSGGAESSVGVQSIGASGRGSERPSI